MITEKISSNRYHLLIESQRKGAILSPTDYEEIEAYEKEWNIQKPMSHSAPEPEAKPLTPEKQALLRAVEIYLKCDQYAGDCQDDCKLLRRHGNEWSICAHLSQAEEIMMRREQGK